MNKQDRIFDKPLVEPKLAWKALDDVFGVSSLEQTVDAYHFAEPKTRISSSNK
ncbi:hypothetical protein [Parageobacillus sp. VR-IP]|uniref:hypothetical protein n=1 Tax=Parageobacillus sp. VR-IP TaxID=2742205 RepID=UPI0020C77A3E|nr:hypothetical protein [Parageobacillus sp. VR-IP]